MKNRIFVLGLILMMGFCSPPSGVERSVVDGVEIITNPSESEARSPLFNFSEEFAIDLEDKQIAELDLIDIWGFDVDSSGCIYVFKPPMSDGNRIVKFDRNGDYLFSFAPPGQGPGEIQFPSYQKMNSRDELPLADLGQSKLLIFDTEGQVIDEIRVYAFPGSMGSLICLLENGHYLIRRSLTDPSSGVILLVLSIFDSEFQEIKELDRFRVVQPIRADKFRLPMQVSVWCASSDSIYVANEDNGYEIQVFDFDGNLKRKIRKKCNPIRVNENYKREILEKLEGAPEILKNKMYFPDNFPPFSYMFTDDKDNLYVKTYRQGNTPQEWVFDVFNPAGVFVGTVNIQSHVNDPFFTPGAPFDSWVVSFQNDRLYTLREKDGGYKELVIFRVH